MKDNYIYLIFALIIFILLYLIKHLIILFVISLLGFPSGTTINLLVASDNTLWNRNLFRLTSFLNQIFMFVIPSVTIAKVFSNKRATNYLAMNVFPNYKMILVSLVLLLCSIPIIHFSALINSFIPFPEWAINMEVEKAALYQNLLHVDSFWEMGLNIFTIAVTPAIAEEMFFRGILQKSLIQKIQSPNLAILIGAIIFSAVHFQFQGFLPRVVSGFLLGFLFYHSKTLWLPSIIHFTINSIFILGTSIAKISKTGNSNTDINDFTMWITVAIASFFVLLLLKFKDNWLIQEKIYDH